MRSNTVAPAPGGSAKVCTDDLLATEAGVAEVDPTALEPHPACAIFPMLTEPELEALAASIVEQGQLEPAIRYGRHLLDGRNRAEACRRLGRKLLVRVWVDHGGDPTDFVISCNLRRRHLTDAQRAMVAVRLVRACQQGTGGDPPTGGRAHTQAEAAERLSVRLRSVQRAARVHRRAPELAALVDQGLSLHAAELVARLPAAERRTLAKAGCVAVRDAAAGLRRAGRARGASKTAASIMDDERTDRPVDEVQELLALTARAAAADPERVGHLLAELLRRALAELSSEARGELLAQVLAEASCSPPSARCSVPGRRARTEADR